jgi:DnaJ family protein C protein 13
MFTTQLQIKSLNGLSSVFGLIRCVDDSQSLQVELTSGQVRVYFSTERDSLLSSLMDGARAAGNCAVCVKSRPTPQGKRWGPVSSPVDEKVESLFLKFLHQPPPTWAFQELLVRFNANVQYSGIIHSVTANVRWLSVI